MTAAAAPVRHFTPPTTAAGWLVHLRFMLARRALQFGLLVAFFGTAHWGFAVLGRPLLAGNLSAARVAGAVPLADPLAVLQVLASRHWLATEVLVGAGLVLAVYALIGGRTFCAWVCPLNVVTDAAAWVRARWGPQRDLVRLSPALRYGVLALALVLSFVTGVAAFDWVSPIATLHRELVFGAGIGLAAVAAVFAFDAAVVRRGWCGHVCPLGAFWALAGRAGRLAVRWDAGPCTRCGDCVKACPEPRALDFRRMEATGHVPVGECLNCGKCIVVCPEACLAFGARAPAAKRIPTRSGVDK